jgi:hypothetical protein
MSSKASLAKCALCLQEKELLDSHIIPAFVFKWIKDTSATGFLRMAKNPNLRRQDGPKIKLLCKKCESLLNDYETLFANNIFHPYVKTELDDYGIATGRIKYFYHDDWLLRFIISLHWRFLFTKDYASHTYPTKFTKILDDIKEDWRQFVLKEKQYTGDCESHIIFFQNMASGTGFIPPNMNDKINYYLLRATDGGRTSSKNKLGVFSKIGPIAFFTAIKPNKLKNTNDSRVHMRGKVKTAQHLSNPLLTHFFFIARPNEVMPKMGFSERQWVKIENAYKKNPERAEKSMTLKAVEGDNILKMRKELQEELK